MSSANRTAAQRIKTHLRAKAAPLPLVSSNAKSVVTSAAIDPDMPPLEPDDSKVFVVAPTAIHHPKELAAVAVLTAQNPHGQSNLTKHMPCADVHHGSNAPEHKSPCALPRLVPSQTLCVLDKVLALLRKQNEDLNLSVRTLHSQANQTQDPTTRSMLLQNSRVALDKCQHLLQQQVALTSAIRPHHNRG